MMMNVIACQPEAALSSVAPAETNESGDFSTLLETQLAAATEEIAPEALLQAEDERELSDRPDEADAAALWLAAVGLNSAAGTMDSGAPQPAGQPSPAEALSANDSRALPVLADRALPQTESQRAIPEMLRMSLRPQAGHSVEKSAERPTPEPHHNQAVLIKSAINPMQHAENENAHNALPVKPTPLTAAMSAAPVFSAASLATPAPVMPTLHAMPSTAHATLEPEVGSPAWQQALGQQLSSFTRNGIHHAELRLHPEHLGPLKINLRLHQDQVQLHFITDQQPVRAALEAAMPHLRTSLAESGIQLDQGSVGSDAPAWGSAADSHSGQSSSSQRQGSGLPPLDGEEEVAPPMMHSGSGINIFA